MLARITPPNSSASGAAVMPSPKQGHARRTKASSVVAVTDGVENAVSTGAAATANQTSSVSGVNSKSLPAITNSAQADQSLSFLRSLMLTNPATALASHGNVTADTVLSLAQE